MARRILGATLACGWVLVQGAVPAAAQPPVVTIVAEFDPVAFVELARTLGLLPVVAPPEAAADHLPAPTAGAVLLIGQPDRPLVLPAALWERLTAYAAAGGGLYAELLAFDSGVEELFGFRAAGPPATATGERAYVMSAAHPITGALERYDLLDLAAPVRQPGSALPGAHVLVAGGRVLGTFHVHLGAVGIPAPQPLLVVAPGDRAIYCTSSLHEALRDEWEPRERWLRLARECLLHVLPPAMRQRTRQSVVLLSAWTEPRRWQVTGAALRIFATVEPPMPVSARLEDGSEVPLTPDGNGRYLSAPVSLPEGVHLITVRAATGTLERTHAIPVRVAGRREAYLGAVQRNVEWLRHSGVLACPDGASGVYTAVDGRTGQLDEERRPETAAETALALWYAGRVLGGTACAETARNVMEFALDGLEGPLAAIAPLPQASPESSSPRLTGGVGLSLAAAGRAALACLAFAQRTGDREAQAAGERLARLLASAVTADGGWAVDRIDAGAPGDVESLAARAPLAFSPAAQGPAAAALPFAAGLSDDAALLRAGLRALEFLRAHHPSRYRYAASESGLAADLLLVAAQWLGETSQHLAETYEVLAYVDDRLVSSGAYRESGNRDRDSFEGCAVFNNDGETICDVAGSASRLLLALWHVAVATGDSDVRLMFERLADFLVRCQIDEPDRPHRNGGWMRAFDYAGWRWYGRYAGPACSPYRLETARGNAAVTLALSLYLLEEGLFWDGTTLPAPGAQRRITAVKSAAEPFLPVGGVPPAPPPPVAEVGVVQRAEGGSAAVWTALGGGQAWYYLVYLGEREALARGEFRDLLRVEAPPAVLPAASDARALYVTAVDAHSQEGPPSAIVAIP